MLFATLAAAVLAAVSGVGAAPPPPRPEFAPVSIAFWDERNGLVAGVERRPDGHVLRARVDVTHDGGRTWTIVGRAPGSMRVAAVRHGRAGFLVGARGLFATADRGRTWRLVSRRRVAAVSFATPRAGFALVGAGDRSLLLRTRDGGRSWRRMGSPCPYVAAAVVRTTPLLGWLLCVGVPATAMQPKALYRTRDGGRTWSMVAWTPLAPGGRKIGGLPALGHPRGIDFLPDGHGWLWQGRGDFIATRDGGRRWWTLSISRPELVEGGSATLLGDRVGVALLFYRDLLVLTNDAGRTWRPLYHWG